MGEYGTVIATGEHIKMGTCSNMYYLRYEDRHKVKGDEHDVNPSTDNGLYWRLPLKEEDCIDIGSYSNHMTKATLYRTPSSSDDLGFLTCSKCTEDVKAMTTEERKASDKHPFLYLSSIKNDAVYGVVPAVECEKCDSLFWYETWADVWDYIQDDELKKRLSVYSNLPIKKHSVLERYNVQKLLESQYCEQLKEIGKGRHEDVLKLLYKEEAVQERIRQKYNKLKQDSREKAEQAIKSVNGFMKNDLMDISKVETRFSYIQLFRKKPPVREIETEVEGQELEVLQSISNGCFYSGKLIIVKNKKPVNKYSLAVVFNHIFRGDVCSWYKHRLFFGSADGVRSNHDTSIIIKDAPSVADLFRYANKKKNLTKMRDFITVLDEMSGDAQDVLDNCLGVDWTRAYIDWRIAHIEKRGSGNKEETQQLKHELETLNS